MLWLLLKHMSKGALRSRLCIQLICIKNIATISTISYKYFHQNLQCWQKLWGLSLTYILLTVRRWILMIRKCKLEPIAWDGVFHIYHIWGIVTKYWQHEVLKFADKLHIQYIPFKLLSVSDTAEYIQKTLWMMRNQTIRHRKTNKIPWCIKLSEPETDNLGKDIS